MTTTVPLSGALLPCARQRGSVSTSLTTAVPQRQLPHHCCEIPRLIPTPPSPTARWLSCAEQEPVGVPTVKSPAATPRSRKKRRAAILEPFHAWLRGTASTESVWVNEHPRSDDAVKPPRPLDIGFRLPTDAHRDARGVTDPVITACHQAASRPRFFVKIRGLRGVSHQLVLATHFLRFACSLSHIN